MLSPCFCFPIQIPANISYEGASTLPMCFTAAATGLYLTGALTPPWSDSAGAYAGKPIVISGASGSVGQYGESLNRSTSLSPSHPMYPYLQLSSSQSYQVFLPSSRPHRHSTMNIFTRWALRMSSLATLLLPNSRSSRVGTSCTTS